MSFLYPSFLWALFALLIPIAIHLFNFRRYKVVYFTNVKFLKDLQQKSKSKSQLKELLVLLCRILALAALILAFAQPFLPGKNNQNLPETNKVFSIYIDNSFSTQNVNKQGQVLEIAKLKAKDLLKTFSNSDKVQIITNDFEGRHQRLYSKQDAVSLIEDIKPSASIKPISKVLKRQLEFLRQSNTNSKKIFVFSDAQKSTFDLENCIRDSLVQVYLVPILPNLVNNIFIDSCWFESPYQQFGFTQKLHVRIVNNGNRDIDVFSARLIINQQQTALSSFSLDANSKTEVKFTFNCKQQGFNFCEIKIDDYPISFDDNLYFTFNSSNHIEVSIVNGKTNHNRLASLFKSDSLFKLNESGELTTNYSSFKTSDLIILNQVTDYSSGLMSELTAFTKKGGSILVIPNLENDFKRYNEAYKLLQLPSIIGLDTSVLKTNEIDQQKGFYENVFEKKEERMNLPKIKKHFQLKATANFESILMLQNGDILLGNTELNKSKVYLMSTSLEPEASNFFNHALLVPTLYKICFGSMKQSKLFFSLNSDEFLEMKSNPDYVNVPPSVYNISQKTDFIPEYRISQNNLFFYFLHQPQQPGFYILKHQTTELLPLAFNYSRIESRLSNYSLDELQALIEKSKLSNFELINYQESKAGDLATLINGGQKLWKLFLLLALAFMLIEVSLLRFLIKTK